MWAACLRQHAAPQWSEWAAGPTWHTARRGKRGGGRTDAFVRRGGSHLTTEWERVRLGPNTEAKNKPKKWFQLIGLLICRADPNLHYGAFVGHWPTANTSFLMFFFKKKCIWGSLLGVCSLWMLPEWHREMETPYCKQWHVTSFEQRGVLKPNVRALGTMNPSAIWRKYEHKKSKYGKLGFLLGTGFFLRPPPGGGSPRGQALFAFLLSVCIKIGINAFLIQQKHYMSMKKKI